MSVDKFGRHQDLISRQANRGPPGAGFHLTANGHYDMKNRQIRNMAEPKAGKDAVTLHYLKLNCLNCSLNGNFDCQGKIIGNVADPVISADVATKGYVQKYSLIKKEDNLNEFTADNLRLTSVGDARNESDAINLKVLNREIMKINSIFEAQLVRLGSTIFNYIHREDRILPSHNIDNKNYLDWTTIHRRTLQPPPTPNNNIK